IGIRSCYDEGKRVAETLMMDYHRQYRIDIRIVRIFNTYGPRMAPDDGRVVSNFILQALQGEEITLYGDGRQTRSFCYVSDLIRGLIQMMETPDLTGPINLGNPEEFTVLELAEKVIALTGSRSKIVKKPLPQDDPTQRRPDITRAKQSLGWTPSIQLEEGLKKTIAYFAERLRLSPETLTPAARPIRLNQNGNGERSDGTPSQRRPRLSGGAVRRVG
ncbi:MAG: GDP-mannose 4,6-dehydratase, partial [Nitrospirae bacterium]|nr:GDP-mannose 4,6-dehydratase [Candidatus Manganitrophaceae bacterium]